MPRAIRQFQRQTYTARELIIVDDGRDPVQDLVPDDPRIRYVRAEPCASLGAKRNLACSLARGALLAHWDDDDWMSDARLATQVAALRAARAEVVGLAAVRYFDSYEAALRAAHVNPATVRRRRQWTRDAVVTALRKAKRRGTHLSDSAMRGQYPALYGAAVRLFGSFPEARKAAGVPWRPKR